MAELRMRDGQYLFHLEMFFFQQRSCVATMGISNATLTQVREFAIKEVRQLNRNVVQPDVLNHTFVLEYTLSGYQYFFGWKEFEIIRGELIRVSSYRDLEALLKTFDISFEIDLTRFLS